MGELSIWRDTKEVFVATLEDLHQVWDSVSWKICQQRDNPACADAEHAAAGRADDPGMHVALSFDPAENVAAPFLNLSRPKLARPDCRSVMCTSCDSKPALWKA